MKVRLKETETFTPIKLELTIDNIQEARLLFHVLNMGRLLDQLKTVPDSLYSWHLYDSDIAQEFNGNGWEMVRFAVRERGGRI
jgi:hypothetical protein